MIAHFPSSIKTLTKRWHSFENGEQASVHKHPPRMGHPTAWLFSCNAATSIDAWRFTFVEILTNTL